MDVAVAPDRIQPFGAYQSIHGPEADPQEQGSLRSLIPQLWPDLPTSKCTAKPIQMHQHPVELVLYSG